MQDGCRDQQSNHQRCFPASTEETTFVTYFGHLTSYDAGYYGYTWADAIAADMATVFEEPEPTFKTIARRLRGITPREDRDANDLIEILGRESPFNPILKSIGIEP